MRKSKSQEEASSPIADDDAAAPWWKNTRFRLAAYAVGLTFVCIAVFQAVKDDRVYLGGDNADYYILAESLASGQGYRYIASPDAPLHNHFPPGYPALLALCMKVGITEHASLAHLNGFFLWAALMCLLAVFASWSGSPEIAGTAIALCIMNGHLLEFSTILMSEVPYLLFFSIALLCHLGALRADASGSTTRWWLVGLVCASVSMVYMRSAGLITVFAMAAHMAWRKHRAWAFTLAVTVIVSQIPWQVRSAGIGPNPYGEQLMQVNPYHPEMGRMTASSWAHRIGENMVRYALREIPNSVFPWTTRKLDTALQPTEEWPWMVLCLPLLFAGWWFLRRDRSLIGAILLCSFGVLMLWPPVWAGPRFMLALVPVVVFLVLNGARALLELTVKRVHLPLPVAWATLVVAVCPVLAHSDAHVLLEGDQLTSQTVGELSKQRVVKTDAGKRICYTLCVKGLAADKRNDYARGYREYLDLAEWSAKNLVPAEGKEVVVCCRKPGLFHLLSHHRVTGFLKTGDPAVLIAGLKAKQVTHVVLDQMGFADVDRYLYTAVRHDPMKFPLVKKQISQNGEDETFLLGFRPELGYTGAWLNGMKHGRGELRTPDGGVFTGAWVNDTVHGEGIVRYPDGSWAQGNWYANKLNGPGRMALADGTVQEGIWKNNELVQPGRARSNDGSTPTSSPPPPARDK